MKKLSQKSALVRGAHDEAERAFARVQPQLSALDASELIHVNVDVPQAASIVLAAEPAIRALKEDIAKLHAFDVAHVESLRDVALAAWYAFVTVADVDAGPSTRAMVDEAAQLKRRLLVHADALAEAGLLDIARIAAIKEGRGNRDLANDLIALAALYREAKERIAGKTVVSERELERSASLGTMLIEALGAREHSGLPDEASASATRARAFALLVKTYGQVQRGARRL